MIYTVTFNPSLDYIVGLDHFREGQVNRSQWDAIYAGGKGINVSMVLKNLGLANVALGFIGGFTGQEIDKRLKAFGCYTDFVNIASGQSRINVKIKSVVESEINGVGPHLLDCEREKLFEKLDLIKAGDFLVLAGSIPASLPEDTYEKIMKRLENRGIHIIVDASKDLLYKVLSYRPFLIKPNKQELEGLFNTVFTTNAEIIAHGQKLKDQGAQNVLISLAKDGAILIDQDDRVHHQMPAPVGQVKNSVGAGDSMVAGFLAGYLRHQDYQEAFKWGVATGSASAFSDQLANKEQVSQVLAALE